VLAFCPVACSPGFAYDNANKTYRTWANRRNCVPKTRCCSAAKLTGSARTRQHSVGEYERMSRAVNVVHLTSTLTAQAALSSQQTTRLLQPAVQQWTKNTPEAACTLTHPVLRLPTMHAPPTRQRHAWIIALCIATQWPAMHLLCPTRLSVTVPRAAVRRWMLSRLTHAANKQKSIRHYVVRCSSTATNLACSTQYMAQTCLLHSHRTQPKIRNKSNVSFEALQYHKRKTLPYLYTFSENHAHKIRKSAVWNLKL